MYNYQLLNTTHKDLGIPLPLIHISEAEAEYVDYLTPVSIPYFHHHSDLERNCLSVELF